MQALFEAAGRCEKDSPLYLRLTEEAQWGLDFILRTRFGDGYRATSAGATRYTDNRIGNFDDVAVRTHDHSYENFLFAGVEAFAALRLRGVDDALSSIALRAARADFAWAEAVFAARGVEPAHRYEHTYNSGPSQYYAVICWAASCLYDACGEECSRARSPRTSQPRSSSCTQTASSCWTWRRSLLCKAPPCPQGKSRRGRKRHSHFLFLRYNK